MRSTRAFTGVKAKLAEDLGAPRGTIAEANVPLLSLPKHQKSLSRWLLQPLSPQGPVLFLLLGDP